MKVKNLLTIFAIATLLVSISGSSGFSVYAEDSIDDTQSDENSQTDREKIKEKIKEEKQKNKEFREAYKAKLEEKKKKFADYKKDLSEKYNALKDEYRAKYLQLRISTTGLDESASTDSSSNDSDDQNYQLEIKREELKLLKQEFREHIKSLKLEAREHFDIFKAELKSSLEDRKNKMNDRINALKEKYKQKIVEHDSTDSINVDGYPPEFSDKKISLCHMPPGNSDNAHTISISVNAIRAHLGHGDYLDECEDESNDESDNETEEEFELKVRAETLGDQSEVRIELTFLTETTDLDMIIEEIIENFALSSDEADTALKIEDEDDEELEEKFEVEIDIEDDITEVEIELRFILDTTDRDLIIDAITERTQLTTEQIEGILVEESDEDEDNDDEADGQEFKVELKEELGLEQTN